jgi:DNA-3-methyladenine glycosylase I
MKKNRCKWADSHPLLAAYHDEEWGVPVHEDRLLFEMLNLEGAQAGLSWLTVLKKRENYQIAFEGFEAKKIAKYSLSKEAVLMKNEGLIRNRLKIHAVVENAKAFLKIQDDFGSFDKFLWRFVNGKPVLNSKNEKALETSERMSRELKKNGFRFVGGTICYAFMQGVGMVNDHEASCFARKKILTR